MKGLLAIILLALIWTIVFTVQRDTGNYGEREAPQSIHSVQKSTRNEQNEQEGTRARNSPKRSTAELEATWRSLLLTDNLSLFSEKEMTSFLKTLNQQEVALLAQSLIKEPDNRTALSRIIGRWAEFAPLDVLHFLIKENINHDLFHHQLYVGWAKEDATAAFAHFQKSRGIQENSTVELLTFSFIKSEFMRSMTLSDPSKAVSVLLAQSTSNREAIDLERNFSDSERDAVFEKLPAGTDWKATAELFADRIFLDHLKQPFSSSSGIMKRGPGGMLFARWANEDPIAAIAWFEANANTTESQKALLEVPEVSDLIQFWHKVNPGAAASWIQE